MVSAALFDTYLAHLVMTYSSLLVLHPSYKPTMMLIGQVAQKLGNPLLDGVCFLELLVY